MRGLRVALVGAGAVGNEAARHLAMAGCGEILVIDPDRVEESNLSRSVFFRSPGVRMGENKANALALSAAAGFPDTRFSHLGVEVADAGWARLRDCALILCAVDRDSARLETARIATRLGVPMADAGLSTQNTGRGRVTWFPATAEAACFGCRLTARRRRELLTTWRSSVHPCGAPPAEPGGFASTPTMAALTGALLVDTALRSMMNPMKQPGAFSLELEIAPGFTAARVEHRQSPDCPFHTAPPTLMAAKNAPFSTFLGEMTWSWEWSLCLDAECLQCRHRWMPAQRVARFLREGRCPQCVSPQVRMIESLRQISAASPWARFAPEQIGLPPDHLYTCDTSSSSPESPPAGASA